MTVRIEKVKNRIHLWGWAGPQTPALCKSIPGYSFSPKKPGSTAHWSFPLDMTVCRDLRKAFGQSLKIGDELFAWASTERDVYNAQVELAGLNDVDLERLHIGAPVLAEAMDKRTYQKVGVAFMAGGDGVLNGDQPGLGKTLETLGAIIENGQPGPYLVLCPKTAVRDVWERQAQMWLAGAKYAATAAIGDRDKRLSAIEGFWHGVESRPDAYHFLICNVEMASLRRYYRCPTVPDGRHTLQSKKCDMIHGDEDIFVEPEYAGLYREAWAGIVIDESHQALVVSSGRGTQRRDGIMKLPLRSGSKRFALSGTPMRGKVKNLWGTLNWLRPELYTSRWRWLEKYFDVSDNGYGKDIGDLRKEKQDEFYESLAAIMLRRTKSEVLKDLPEKQYVDVEIEMEGKQAKAYAAMERDAAANLKGGTLTATGVLAELTRLKQFASSHGKIEGSIETARFFPDTPSNKLDWLSQFLAERGFFDGEGDSKVVVASQFTKLINLFARTLEDAGIPSYRITGETTASLRTQYRNEFQSDQVHTRLMFINIKAGGVAIDLDAADELVFLDETWIPDDQEQVEDRIHRASRMHSVTIYRLRSESTIEQRIADTNINRDRLQKEIMDGRRGIPLALRLLGEE